MLLENVAWAFVENQVVFFLTSLKVEHCLWRDPRAVFGGGDAAVTSPKHHHPAGKQKQWRHREGIVGGHLHGIFTYGILLQSEQRVQHTVQHQVALWELSNETKSFSLFLWPWTNLVSVCISVSGQSLPYWLSTLLATKSSWTLHLRPQTKINTRLSHQATTTQRRE